jgi:propanediol dehydratase small subunit
MQTDSFAEISAATLKYQAAKARDAGFVQLSHNFLRAAELTVVPDNEILAIYELLRPGRSTHAELCTTADKLELIYGASETAAFVRDAAAEYLRRNLFRPQ